MSMVNDSQGAAQASINLSGLLLGLLLTIILGGVTCALIFFSIPKDNQNALLILIGILSTNIGVIINWHYGSSAAARAQTETISTMANSAAAVQAALPTTVDPKEKKVILDPGETATVKAKAVMPEGVDAVLWAAMTPEQQAAAATKKVA